MTTLPDDGFHVETTFDGDGDACLLLEGDLDWDTADDLTRAALDCLDTTPPPPRLRLDLAGLRMCDSMGLAALLTIRRRTGETGTALRLDNRPAFLERLLEVTGTLNHLVGPVRETRGGPLSRRAGEDGA
ncbi:STAS domain-containing protein [Streptomyces sp. NPDC050560]|uniref:STAS domain-containing protein n=1 Tax=Streptomyces sp. NPDC050560 TaxID=3365630 RepID=UPI0037B3483B